EIAGRVVTGSSRQECRPMGAGRSAAFMTKASHRLCDLLPAAAMAERTAIAVAVDGGVDDARSQRRELFGSEAQLGASAGTIALREAVRRLDQSSQARRILALREIEETAAFAVIRIENVLWDLR